MNIRKLIKSLFSKKAEVTILTIGKVSKITLGGGKGIQWEGKRPHYYGTDLPSL